MIVMVNGPFGVGKRTVAQVLCPAIPNAMLYDPEIVGTRSIVQTCGISARSSGRKTSGD